MTIESDLLLKQHMPTFGVLSCTNVKIIGPLLSSFGWAAVDHCCSLQEALALVAQHAGVVQQCRQRQQRYRGHPVAAVLAGVRSPATRRLLEARLDHFHRQ